MRKLLPVICALTLVLAASGASASPLITLGEFQSLYPAYVNHAVMNSGGFQVPCVDANGTVVLNVNVSDILGTATGPISIAMVCQQPGHPAFTPTGPVTFSVPGIALQSLASVPGHPDAFAIEYVVPLGANLFTITIENTGWPEGCLTEILDLAAWDLASVPVETISAGALKSSF